MRRAAIGSAMAAALLFSSSCRPPMAAGVCAVDDDCPDGWRCDLVRGYCFAYSDAGASDAGASDNGASDTGIGDRQQGDDLGALDVAQRDSAIGVDAAASDTGRSDRRNVDILLFEAGRTDLERVDATAVERGAPDAGACTIGALVFDGVDDRVSVADRTGMDGLALFTIETWIKQTGSANAQRIFSRHKSNTFTGYTLSIVGGRPQFEVSCVDYSSMVTVNANSAIATGTWHHLAAVVDGTHAMLFVDGVRQTEVQPWGGPTTATYATGAYLGGGVSAQDAFAFPFNGAIDSVRLSSTNRFTDNFTPVRHALTVDSATIALWNLDEGAGQIAVDTAGDHDGQLGTAPTQDPADPSWRSAMCAQDN